MKCTTRSAAAAGRLFRCLMCPSQQISRAEAESYGRFVAYCQENIGRVEPMLVGLQHKTEPGSCIGQWPTGRVQSGKRNNCSTPA